MAMALVTVHPFDDYQVGDMITDGDKVSELSSGDRAHHFHKIDRADEEKKSPANEQGE